MSHQDLSNVYFFSSHQDIEASQPYAIHTIENVTFMINRFDAWINLMGGNCGQSAMCIEEQFIHVEIATEWCDAIERSIKYSLFPIVILPINNYDQAILLLKLTCNMDADLNEMIEK